MLEKSKKIKDVALVVAYFTFAIWVGFMLIEMCKLMAPPLVTLIARCVFVALGIVMIAHWIIWLFTFIKAVITITKEKRQNKGDDDNDKDNFAI